MTTPRMPFGKYRGTPLPSVPRWYLQWLLSTDIDDRLRADIQGVLSQWDSQRQPGKTLAKGTGRRP